MTLLIIYFWQINFRRLTIILMYFGWVILTHVLFWFEINIHYMVAIEYGMTFFVVRLMGIILPVALIGIRWWRRCCIGRVIRSHNSCLHTVSSVAERGVEAGWELGLGVVLRALCSKFRCQHYRSETLNIEYHIMV